jgi:dolichol-phosphate mannosyltransferase
MLPNQLSRVAAAELTVVVPSFNEIDNVEPLIERLRDALDGIAWEVIYVDDDSSDGTAAKVRELSQTDPRVRCIQRIGRRGLSTAVIEGMLASSAPYLAVIDADLQHDEKLLPSMLATLKSDGLDIVVGSRYVARGAIGDWDKRRSVMSRIATRLARLVVSAEIADPLSGFFMLHRSAFERTARRLSGSGFKILLDLFASAPTPYRFAELPYVFGERIHGESKLDSLVIWEYLMLLLDKRVGRWVPVRFVLFAAIGGSGVIVHLAALRLGSFSIFRRASHRHRLRDDDQFSLEQHAYVPRSEASRSEVDQGTALVLRDLRHWSGRKYRHCVSLFRPALFLVDLRPCGFGSRCCLELRSIIGLHLAPCIVVLMLVRGFPGL